MGGIISNIGMPCLVRQNNEQELDSESDTQIESLSEPEEEEPEIDESLGAVGGKRSQSKPTVPPKKCYKLRSCGPLTHDELGLA